MYFELFWKKKIGYETEKDIKIKRPCGERASLCDCDRQTFQCRDAGLRRWNDEGCGEKKPISDGQIIKQFQKQMSFYYSSEVGLSWLAKNRLLKEGRKEGVWVQDCTCTCLLIYSPIINRHKGWLWAHVLLELCGVLEQQPWKQPCFFHIQNT